MQTGINYKGLAGHDLVTQRKFLAMAIAFHFAKYAIVHDMMGKRSAMLGAQKMLGADKIEAPDEERVKAALQARFKYATADDTPILMDHTRQIIEYVHENMPELDLGFQLIFDEVDLRGSTHPSFDIDGTSLGLTWKQRTPGANTVIRRSVNEDTLSVPMIEYTEGLGLLDRWLQFQEFWNINEAIAEFQATYFDNQADQHYGLLTALGAGINQAFATDHATTLNNASAAIIRAMRGKGRGVGQDTALVIVCAIEEIGLIEKVLTAQRGSAIVDFGTVSQPVTARVSNVVGTTKIAAGSGSYYLVLPGRKLKTGRWKDLTIESVRNAYVSAEDIVGVGQFNAAIGDQNQVRRVLLA